MASIEVASIEEASMEDVARNVNTYMGVEFD